MREIFRQTHMVISGGAVIQVIPAWEPLQVSPTVQVIYDFISEIVSFRWEPSRSSGPVISRVGPCSIKTRRDFRWEPRVIRN